jgi:hypothetical protein
MSSGQTAEGIETKWARRNMRRRCFSGGWQVWRLVFETLAWWRAVAGCGPGNAHVVGSPPAGEECRGGIVLYTVQCTWCRDTGVIDILSAVGSI